MKAVRVSAEGEVVFPVEVRRALGLKAGDNLRVFVYDGRIELVPVREMETARGFSRGIETEIDHRSS